jgi:hypothetical protein
MRNHLPAILTAAMLLAAPASIAAPTCQDRNGDTVRCGTERAMPVGWTAPAPQQAPSAPVDMFALGVFLFGFFALIALMPNFDGRWDPQERDDEEAD